MKLQYFKTIPFLFLSASLFFILVAFTSKLKIEKPFEASYQPGTGNYLTAFKKKIKNIDISFSVYINGKYESTNKETGEKEVTNKEETIMGGGEGNNTVLEREGLPTKTLSCNGNQFELTYNTKPTYISSEGVYSVIGEVSADGKEIKSLKITYKGKEGTEQWSYDVIAVNIPWAGSLGKNFDKVKRNYNYKFGTVCNSISKVDYEKISETEGWSFRFNGGTISPDKSQDISVYFTFE